MTHDTRCAARMQHLTSLTSQVEDTTAKPEGWAAATAWGDAIMMLVGDMLCTQRPPSSWTASVRSVLR